MIERLGRRLLPAGGALVLALALATVFAGDAVSLLEPLSALGGDAVVLAVAGVTGLLTLASHAVRSMGGDAAEPADRTGLTDAASTRLGAEGWTLTDPIDEAVEPPEIGTNTYHLTARGKTRRSARNRARRLAIETVSSVEGRSREAAANRVRDGAWTDDPRAAAFVGSPRLPLRIRFVDWLTGAGYRRGLEATLDELEALESRGAARSGTADADRSGATETGDRLDSAANDFQRETDADSYEATATDHERRRQPEVRP